MASKTFLSFNSKFWNPNAGCLFEVISPDRADSSLRPNQIFAVSLDFAVLDEARRRLVVDVVERELVTRYGLRTLAAGDAGFRGKCVGDRASRDRAYHNGTIWPWLLGPFITAYLRTRHYEEESRMLVLRELIVPLFSDGIRQAGLGSLAEIFDADPPHTARGCISQAWSIAEPLRAYIEDALLIKPQKENSA
jgi:glycogen debranching enzyme